jgi:hypothetical protein
MFFQKSERLQQHITTDDKCYNELRGLLEEIRATKLMFRNNNNNSISNYVTPVIIRNNYQRDFDHKYNRNSNYLNADKQIMPIGSIVSYTPSYLNNLTSTVNKGSSRGIHNSSDYLTHKYTHTPYVKQLDYKEKSNSTRLVPHNDANLYRSEEYDAVPKSVEYKSNNSYNMEKNYEIDHQVDFIRVFIE